MSKITKVIATRCHILTLKCAKFDFGWGTAHRPGMGAYSAPWIPQLDLKGFTLKGNEGRGKKGMKWIDREEGDRKMGIA